MRTAPRRLRELLGFIGANVQRLRIARRWTQSHLAGFSGQDLSTIQRVENGTQNLTMAVLVSLAEALDVPPISLLRPAKREPARRGRPRAMRRAR